MVKWIKENGTYKHLLITLLIGVISWMGIQFFILPDKYVRTERYTADLTRTEKTLLDIQKDIKEILKVLR